MIAGVSLMLTGASEFRRECLLQRLRRNKFCDFGIPDYRFEASYIPDICFQCMHAQFQLGWSCFEAVGGNTLFGSAYHQIALDYNFSKASTNFPKQFPIETSFTCH